MLATKRGYLKLARDYHKSKVRPRQLRALNKGRVFIENSKEALTPTK